MVRGSNDGHNYSHLSQLIFHIFLTRREKVCDIIQHLWIPFRPHGHHRPAQAGADGPKNQSNGPSGAIWSRDRNGYVRWAE